MISAEMNRRMGGVGTQSAVVLAVNFAVGIPGIIPVIMVIYFLVSWPLDALGLTHRDPTENDGMFPMVMLLGLIVLPCFLIWILLAWLLKTRTPALRSWYFWCLSVAAMLLPTTLLFVVQALR